MASTMAELSFESPISPVRAVRTTAAPTPPETISVPVATCVAVQGSSRSDRLSRDEVGTKMVDNEEEDDDDEEEEEERRRSKKKKKPRKGKETALQQ